MSPKKSKKKITAKKRAKARPSITSFSPAFPKPKTRFQEILCLMLQERTPMSNVEVAFHLNNINAHKARSYWKEKGVHFRRKMVLHKNRFGRLIAYNVYAIRNTRIAKKAYKKSFNA